MVRAVVVWRSVQQSAATLFTVCQSTASSCSMCRLWKDAPHDVLVLSLGFHAPDHLA